MSPGDRERLIDLLTDEATQGLGPEELAELASLLARHPQVDRDEIAMLAAALDLGLTSERTPEPLPDALRARIEAAARAFFADRPVRRPTPVRWRGAALAGWTAAAAGWLLVLVLSQPTRAPQPPTLLEAAQRVAGQPGSVRAVWSAGGDPTGTTATGDVVWNGAAQEGFMRFRGLEKNDPRVSQYQLWIFDEKRNESHPVDGGVFDVTSDGEVVVPIRAKLRVFDPTLFAVTVEPPGGVVVSSRQRIALTARSTR